MILFAFALLQGVSIQLIAPTNRDTTWKRRVLLWHAVSIQLIAPTNRDLDADLLNKLCVVYFPVSIQLIAPTNRDR